MNYLCPVQYPTNAWYRKHLNRNFDCVILGNNTVKIDSTSIDGEKIFRMSMNNQTFLWDYYVLKHFFSVLKPKGIAYFPVTEIGFINGYHNVKDKRPYYFDFMSYFFSHRYWKIFLIKVLKNLPILMLRPKDLCGLVLRYLGVNLQDIYVNNVRSREKRYKKYTDKKIIENELEKTFWVVKQMKEFCSQRDIIPVVVLDCTETLGYTDKIINSLSDIGIKSIIVNDKNN